MPADVLIPLPAGVSDRTASTLMMKGLTAQYLFRQVYPLKGGETILYHAAAGGVGLVACQWARAIGVTMIGTVSTDEKAEVARANGCAHTIVTSREDIAKRVREITDGKGVPVVYDSVGKDTLMASLDSLQPRGTLVSNGTTSGPVVIDTTLLAVKGSIWVTRPAMVHYATPRSQMLAMADELFGHVLAGHIAGEPKQEFALADAAEAHRALESRRTTGATVLVP
jgi:NADPH2:quinone reductase